MYIVEFNRVTKLFDNRKVLNDISFVLESGSFTYLVGRTGAGKSTLLKLIYADLKPDIGSVRVADFEIENLTWREIPYLRRKLGIVFQDFQLLPDRTVEQNLRFVLQATGWKNKTQILQRITKVLMQVGLSAKHEAYPHELSGGEQQRVAIARAMLNDPVLLIADEPTGNLDPEASDYIMKLLFQINHSGTTVLFATHEYELIRKFPSYILQLREGNIQNISTNELI